MKSLQLERMTAIRLIWRIEGPCQTSNVNKKMWPFWNVRSDIQRSRLRWLTSRPTQNVRILSGPISRHLNVSIWCDAGLQHLPLGVILATNQTEDKENDPNLVKSWVQPVWRKWVGSDHPFLKTANERCRPGHGT